MFLGTLRSTAIVMAVSIGSSITMGAGAQDMLRINIPNVDLDGQVVAAPKAPTHRAESSVEALQTMLAELVYLNRLSYSTRCPLITNSSNNHSKAQKARVIAQQTAERKALRKVTRSFKPSAKSLHQPR